MHVAQNPRAGPHPRRAQSTVQAAASQSREVTESRQEKKSGNLTHAKRVSLAHGKGFPSEETHLKFHLLGNVSSTDFQSIRKIVQWIANTYAPTVEICCQEEFEETAARLIKEQATELGGDVLKHPSTEWLLYAVANDGAVLYFRTRNDILKWASVEFLYQGPLPGEDDKAREDDIGRVTAEKISSVIKTSGNAFCRITFGIRSPLSEWSALRADPGGSEALPLANVHSLDVLFEIFKQHVPKTSAAFLNLAQRGHYDGCPIHRLVPGGWIQTGDLVDGSGAHSGTVSVYSSPENFVVAHDGAGVLGMCPCRSGGTGTQFYVSLKSLEAFDKKFVAFGRAVMGMNALLRFLQQQRVSCDVNSQRPIGDSFFIKKMEVFND